MAWIYLIIAGLFEVTFTSFLKLSDNFTRTLPTIGFIAASAVSFYTLSLSLKTIPLGTSYAVWTGIGAFGTALIGIIFFQESTDPLRLFFLFLLIFAIVGLKVATPT